MLSTLPVEVADAAVFWMLRMLPLVSEDELSVKAVCVVREFHVQVCAMLVLSIVFIAVPEVRDESAVAPPPPLATHEVTPAVVLEST